MEENDTFHPLEIKKHADPSVHDLVNFSVIDRMEGIERGPGGVISLYDRLTTLRGADRAIPANCL